MENIQQNIVCIITRQNAFLACALFLWLITFWAVSQILLVHTLHSYYCVYCFISFISFRFGEGRDLASLPVSPDTK